MTDYAATLRDHFITNWDTATTYTPVPNIAILSGKKHIVQARNESIGIICSGVDHDISTYHGLRVENLTFDFFVVLLAQGTIDGESDVYDRADNMRQAIVTLIETYRYTILTNAIFLDLKTIKFDALDQGLAATVHYSQKAVRFIPYS